jgi:hypothetical protein
LRRKCPEGTYIPSRRERVRDTLSSEPPISLEEIEPFHAKVLEDAAEVSQSTKLRRDSVPRMQAISKGIEFVEGEKVEAFENLKVFQVQKEVRKLERKLQQLLDQR